MSTSGTDKPSPRPGDADTTEVETPQEAPAPFGTPSEDPDPVEAPPAEDRPAEGATVVTPAADPSPAAAAPAGFGSRPAAFSSPEAPDADPPAAGSGGTSLPDRLPDSLTDLTDRPEVLVGAAFAGGLVLAMILKRLGG
jgi:hypothetical protein